MGDVKMANKQRRILLMKDIPNFCLKKFNVNSVPSTLYQFHGAHTLTTIIWLQKETSIHLSLFSCWRCQAANSLLFFFLESHGPRARFPAHPNLFSTLLRLLVAPQKRKLAVVHKKMDRTIHGFSGAIILPTSMKYKKVTDIYKAIHRILRKLLLTESIA